MTPKTILATGLSSGLGWELLSQLLRAQQPYRFFLGVRDPAKTQKDIDQLKHDTSKHDVSLFKVDLANLKEVRTFSNDALSKLGQDKLDYVLLNAGVIRKSHGETGPNGSMWCEMQIVNTLSGHYIVHLLRDKIVASHTRVVFVSSGAARLKDISGLREKLLAKTSDSSGGGSYGPSKFTQLLTAHWWRRNLGNDATVLAVSPGYIPGTMLARYQEREFLDPKHPDAKTPAQGGQNIWRAATREDLGSNPDDIFLTSWGELWELQKEIPLSLDKKLQDEWSLSKEELDEMAK